MIDVPISRGGDYIPLVGEKMSDVFVKPVLTKEGDITGSKTTTVNTYVPIPVKGADSFRFRGYPRKLFVMKAVTNNLLMQIEFSINNTDWVVRIADIPVNVGTIVVKETETNSELRGPWNYCRVQVKPAVADTHGTGSFWFEGSTL